MTDKIMLIDGHSIINRAYHGLPLLSNAQGIHTNAVLGFLNIMLRYLEEEKPTHLLVTFDRREPTFRHLKYKEYKGTRTPMDKELREQVPLVRDILTAMDIPVVTQAGIEADDIMGTIGRAAERENYDVVIVTGDRDILQLATDRTKIKIPKTKAGGTVTEEYYALDVLDAYGVTPKEYIDVKGLMGDASDNIPGVPGIGEKTAQKIITAYHSIENAREHIDEIKPARAKTNLEAYYDQAILSKDLATIKTDCDLDYCFKDAAISDIFTKEAYGLIKKLELKSLYAYFEAVAANEIPMEISVIHDFAEADAVMSDVLSFGTAGLAVIGTAGNCRGLSLTYGEKTALILKEGFMTEEECKDFILRLLSGGVFLQVLDYKALLHFEGRVRDYETRIDDIGLMAYLLNPLQNDYDYEAVASEYLHLVVPACREVCGKQTLAEAFSEEKPKTVEAAGLLSYVPYQAANEIKEALRQRGMESLYLTIERPTAAVLYDMESCGICVKREALRTYGSKLIGRIDELEAAVHTQAGRSFNLNSPKQLGIVLFEELKMPYAKKTKTCYYTSADILEKLATDYPIVKDILEYRQLTKLKSTYADGLAAFIEEDGKIHSVFHQKVTATGRLSSSDPNLQNIPIRMPLGRAIRKVFVPEPGYVFVSADYSQIELRVLAHMAGDENLIAAYRDNQDIHTVTASQVFDVPVEAVTPLLRRRAKAVNFGIVYGISAFGLSQDLDITRKEAAEYIDKYFAAYPGIKAYLDENVAYAKEHGYVKTLYGRIRPIPELSASNFMQRNFGERAAMNSSIQGTAADIIKLAMKEVSRRLKEGGFSSRLILQIHDELLIETKIEEKDQIEAMLREVMPGVADLKVPLIIGVAEGSDWYEAK